MFSAFTQPGYPRSAIGIEKDRISAVSLAREGREFVVRHAATVYAPGVVSPGFTERNISDRSHFRSVVEEALTAAGLLGQKKFSVSLPGNTARSTILTFDNMPSSRSEREEMLEWKAQQLFGAPASDLRIARKKIAPDRDGKIRYFAAAVSLSVIDEFESVFEEMGISAGLILPKIVSESNLLLNQHTEQDSLLISSQEDGFTALVLRRGEPTVVRSVTCSSAERDDEIYRLLMFYHDRFSNGSGMLGKILAIGRDFARQSLLDISSEALGRPIDVIGPDEIGLRLPPQVDSFENLAAPAGLAALAYS